MPATTEKQAKFMRAEYGRKKRGLPTLTSMTTKQLADFTKLAKNYREATRGSKKTTI